MATAQAAPEPDLIAFCGDSYGGIRVDASEPANARLDTGDKVHHVLGTSLDQWQAAGVRAVWIKAPLQHVHWVPAAVRHGFTYHHAKPAYVMLTKWLADDACTIPSAPYTNVGAGGLVVSADGLVLLMRERTGPYTGWKFPGGLLDAGESVYGAVQCEVLEETGVRAAATGVLAIRHWHCAQSIGSVQQSACAADIYFVCAMQPAGGDASAGDNEPKQSTREAAACRWFTRAEIDTLPPGDIRPFHHSVLQRYDEHAQRLAAKQASIACDTVHETNRSYDMFYLNK